MVYSQAVVGGENLEKLGNQEELEEPENLEDLEDIVKFIILLYIIWQIQILTKVKECL